MGLVYSKPIAYALGFAYPAYASFKALQSSSSSSTGRCSEDRQWLMYWIVYALFTCGEYFTDKILWWFPFYYAVKIPFILYLQHPRTRGAEQLYTRYVSPFFTRNEAAIDEHLSAGGGRAAQQKFAELSDQAMAFALEKAREFAEDELQKQTAIAPSTSSTTSCSSSSNGSNTGASAVKSKSN
eukprot:ANDGO_00790.mRNA.1 HVA22-like protein k